MTQCSFPNCGCKEALSTSAKASEMARRVGKTFTVNAEKLGRSPICGRRTDGEEVQK